MERVPITNVIQYNFEASNNLKTHLSGGMWTGDIPESRQEDETEVPVAMPYARVQLEESANEYMFGDKYIEHGKVSITVYDTSADNVNTIIKELETEWPPSIDLEIPPDNNDTSFLHIYQLRKSLASEFMKDKDGNQVYSGLLLYEISLFRQ